MPDPQVAVLPTLDPPTRQALTALTTRSGRARGASPLGDPALAELAGRRSGPAVVPLVATRAGATDPVGYAHLDPPLPTPAGTDPPPAPTWTVGIAVDAPPTGSDAAGVAAVAIALLRRAVAHVAGHGGGELRWWAVAADDGDVAVARTLDFGLERTLLQLRCPLPLPEVTGTPPAPTRAFRPGHDEAAWLRTNNRAFAGHPEQGGWELPTIEEREQESWFDPDGFRILEEGDDVVGFCWTKIHPATDIDPPLGEIYVIGVDPDAHGSGLGRALVRDGLAWLARRGIRHGMLYVDAANDPAVHLYRALGFRTNHEDRSYVLSVPAAGSVGRQAEPTSRPMP